MKIFRTINDFSSLPSGVISIKIKRDFEEFIKASYLCSVVKLDETQEQFSNNFQDDGLTVWIENAFDFQRLEQFYGIKKSRFFNYEDYSIFGDLVMVILVLNNDYCVTAYMSIRLWDALLKEVIV